MDWSKARTWAPPPQSTVLHIVDAHAAGEPLRVVVGGYPEIPGDTVLARRRFARTNLDHLRTALMHEPRGHADMYGCVLMPPATPGADFSVLFLHNEGYSTMCGHGIIAVATVVLEAGLLDAREPESSVEIDTPAGRVTAVATVRDGRVSGVRFRNVPSWVDALDATVDVPGFGSVICDIAFGGAFYALVDAGHLGLTCTSDRVRDLIDAGRRIKAAISETRSIRHPTDPDLGFLYGTIFVGPAETDGVHSRNVCVFADGEVDRSPTGTGVSARAAALYARGALSVGETITIESIIGSRFSVRIAETSASEGRVTVVPEVSGHAYITGRAEFILDPEDPYVHGFLVR